MVYYYVGQFYILFSWRVFISFLNIFKSYKIIEDLKELVNEFLKKVFIYLFNFVYRGWRKRVRFIYYDGNRVIIFC